MLEPVSGLPAASHRLVARTADVAAVNEALRAGRLVTITGPGGVGKTRLALEVAHQHDGGSLTVWWVDLSALEDGRLVPAAFAEAVGATGTSEDATGDVARFLAPVSGLLVLDNCEHLQDAVAAVVMSALVTCPRLRVLATSREPLHIAGEIVWSLGPLAPDDAVLLFTERAESVRAGASGERVEIKWLCARLEGIPLALELAAGRMTSLSAKAILARLDDRLDMLSTRLRDAPRRHRSLRAAIEWSVELLGESERVAFNRLAVFPGSFSLEAAETVARMGLDVLEGLVAKSLVSVQRAEHDLRYRMLDTIRSYARETLEASDEIGQLRVRHLGFYVERAERIQSDSALGGSDAQVQALVEDLHNLRLALDWAEAHDPEAGLRLIGAGREAWFARSQNEGRRRAELLLELYPDRNRSRALGLLCAGRLAVAQQDHTGAAALLNQALEIAEQCHEPDIQAAALHYIGISGMLSRDLDGASARLKHSVELFGQLGQAQGIGRGLGVFGFVQLYAGDREGADRTFEKAAALVEDCDDAWGVGQVALGLALTAKAAGDTGAATVHLSRSAASLIAAGDRTILGVALTTLAGLTLDNTPDRAVRLAAAAVTLRAQIGGEYPTATIAELASIRTHGSRLLGTATFDAEWEAGLQLSRAEISELARTIGHRPESGPLTSRQREIAALVSQGLTNAQIALRLHLSDRTVENHVFNALRALELHNRVQLAAWVTHHSDRDGPGQPRGGTGGR